MQSHTQTISWCTWETGIELYGALRAVGLTGTSMEGGTKNCSQIRGLYKLFTLLVQVAPWKVMALSPSHSVDGEVWAVPSQERLFWQGSGFLLCIHFLFFLNDVWILHTFAQDLAWGCLNKKWNGYSSDFHITLAIQWFLQAFSPPYELPQTGLSAPFATAVRAKQKVDVLRKTTV